MNLEEKISSLEQSLSEVKKSLSDIAKKIQQRVQWEEALTESGIQIIGGPTTVKKTGVVIGTTLAPISANQAAVVLLIRRDGDNLLAVVDAQLVKFIDG